MPDFLTSSILLLTATFSALAFGLAVVSLLVHWKRPQVHPDVTRVQSEIESLRANHLELLDRVEHWMKRDRVRKLRQGQEEAQGAPVGADEGQQTPADKKAALRRRVAGRLSAVPSLREE